MNDNICPICGEKAEIQVKDTFHLSVKCPACGKVILNNQIFGNKDDDLKDQYASYLFYNNHPEKRGDPVKQKEQICVFAKKNWFEQEYEESSMYQLISDELIENWYPKSFNEKINTFLLMLGERSHFLGDIVLFTDESIASACFVFRKQRGPMKNVYDIQRQADILVEYLVKEGYVDCMNSSITSIRLSPKGIQRVDELQKHETKNSKNVFVAMSFAEEMKPVREAIKKAIEECGFIPRIMDEIEHNHQIVPEMLYEIRKSRFLIAELTNNNNGAYFEEGYALGQGKEVIQVYRSDSFNSKSHFDVKQVNTVLWVTPEDLSEKLVRRIQATIQ